MTKSIYDILYQTPLTDRAFKKLQKNPYPLPEGTKFVLYEDMLALEVMYNKLLEKVKSNTQK